MNIETLREYCISKKDVTESFPFDNDTLVFKADGKIFALVNLDGDLSINLKCDPTRALELRERYPSVIPGYHMNKKHWNTVMVDGTIPDKEVFSWIDHSYNLVKKKDNLSCPFCRSSRLKIRLAHGTSAEPRLADLTYPICMTCMTSLF